VRCSSLALVDVLKCDVVVSGAVFALPMFMLRGVMLSMLLCSLRRVS
jgi:hypothetical protein